MSQFEQRTHIGAYVDAEQRRQLVELAERDDRSVSSVIRIAITEHIQRALTDEAVTAGPSSLHRHHPHTPKGDDRCSADG